MTDTHPQSSSNEDLNRILASAKRLGVEVDEMEALQWLTAVAGAHGQDDIIRDEETGVFGHRITLLDFSPDRLKHFRWVGCLVEFHEEPGVVETALALSGSAAQSKIQTYPGDADYFERVNIKAPTREDACAILSRIMRQKALDTLHGDGYQLIEVKYGSYPFDCLREGKSMKTGSPVSWNAMEIEQGEIQITSLQGEALPLKWDEVASQPGWCKLDWVVIDPVDKQLANASNMLDVTWESPNGEITPLDGYLDPYFQEVYLEAESIPLFTKLAKHVDTNALESYVHQLEKEVSKYLQPTPNYGKAAKRMYNIFRLTGKYQEAAYLRELFDEPTTILYQVWSLIRTIDDCFKPGSTISIDSLIDQADQLIMTVVKVLEGEKEVEIVRLLLRLRDILSRETAGKELSPQAEAARDEVINLVNNFFYDRLTAIPEIKKYMDERSVTRK